MVITHLGNRIVILEAGRFGFGFEEGIVDDDAVVAVTGLVIISPRLLGLRELVGKPA